MHIGGLVAPIPNPCDWWRVVLPLISLAGNGVSTEVQVGVQRIEGKRVAGLKVLLQSAEANKVHLDALLVTRSFQVAPLMLSVLRANNTKLINDWDDDLTNVPRFNPATLEIDPDARLLGVREAALVTCTNEFLADRLREYNKNVIVFPNLFHPQFWTGLPKRPKNRLVVGIQGGPNHVKDWEPLADLFRSLAMRFPDLHFLVAGYWPSWTQDLQLALGGRLQLEPYLPVEQYQDSVNKIDIGLCMVEDSDFNRTKSVVKWVEHSLCGAACVVSPTLYGEVVEHGKTGLVARNPGEWYEHVAELASNKTKRLRIGEAARTYCKNHYSLFDYKWRDRRLSAFRSLIS